MTMSMLKEKNLPKQSRGEAITTSVYVLNKCPTKNLKEVVPIEKWTDRKQSVIRFKVFGYVRYKHIPNATRMKLDDRSKVMLLIGYQSTCAYKFYCPVTNKVEVSRYVRVKESENGIGESLNPTLVQCQHLILILPLKKIFSLRVILTLKESESEDESESESESDSEGDFDSKDESDSDGGSDSKGGPTYEGNPTSEGGTSEVGASKGDPASEGELALF
ncbi:hypothetical protein KIW84_062851 [Lathyrus oleraceus]|uniref:Retroviral polymerase SH3-like domain-containing protein n=1 Tax=Pisum sativum TaxID=3888 RepID=A0A9D4W896_PEA|nr:hypothetical protein KIW84_062851 [Pisum sativum]